MYTENPNWSHFDLETQTPKHRTKYSGHYGPLLKFISNFLT